MIWREFRVHNAVFAYRNLIGAILGIWFPDWWWRHPYTISSIVLKIALTLGTCKAADMVTSAIGDREKRTTNAMPYPPAMKRHQVEATKHYYAKAQFAATSLAVFGMPMLSFGSVLAIEIASFLMTLVRKGIIQRRTYHIVYAASLFIMLPLMLISLHCIDSIHKMATFRAMIATCAAVSFRTRTKMSKYMIWTAAIPFGFLGAELLAAHLNILFVAWMGILWSSIDTVNVFLREKRNDGKQTDAAFDGKQTDAAFEAYKGG